MSDNVINIDDVRNFLDLRMQRDALHARMHAPQPPRPRYPACQACGLDGSGTSSSYIGPLCGWCSIDADMRPKDEFRDVLAWRYSTASYGLRHMRSVRIIPGLAEREGFKFFCEVPGAKASGVKFNYAAGLRKPEASSGPTARPTPPPRCPRSECGETLRKGPEDWWCPVHDRQGPYPVTTSAFIGGAVSPGRDDDGKLASTIPTADRKRFLSWRVHK